MTRGDRYLKPEDDQVSGPTSGHLSADQNGHEGVVVCGAVEHRAGQARGRCHVCPYGVCACDGSHLQ